MADPKIRIRRSATPNKVPTTTQLQLGELAINTYDGKVYLEQDQGGVGVGTTVIAVNPWGVGIGSTAYNTQFTAGKVGIGTTNAQYNLDIGGNVNFTGNLYQDGSLYTSGTTGVGIRTAGGIVGYAATILDFRGPGVTTAYYSSATGIGTINFHSVTSGGGGNASVTVSDSAPSSPSNGDLWFKSDVGELYLWYTDGSSNQWVEASGGSNTVVTQDTAPSSPNDGDLWWNSNTGELKVYYNDGNSSQWVDANSEGGFVQYWTQTNTNGTLGVTTTSYVGIGTTTATDALTVKGNVNVTGVATFSGDVKVGGVLTYEDVKNVDAIGIVTARKGIKALAGGANIVDGTTTDELNVTGISTFAGNIDVNADLDVDGITNLDDVNISGVTTATGGVKVGTAATICSEGNMTIDRPSAGIITATKFIGDGSDLTGVISGIGIGTAGGVVGYAATIVHFKGAGVTTAYYNASTGIGTVFFHSAGGGGGSANVTIADAPPGSPSAGDLWWESDIGELKIYYNDGNSSQWVDASGADSLVQIGTSAPTGAVSGDLWWNSESGDFMVYYTDANSSAWVSVNAVNADREWITNSTGIHTTSNVGIGTTTSTDPLTVVGAADIDGRLIVSGITTFGSHVYHGDNDNAIFGDGSDLSIWHNGTNSHIRNTEGDFVIDNSGGGGLFLRAKQNENSIYAIPDAQVQLYHNNVNKLSTTLGGAKVWGTVGSANTALVVVGDARVTGILTVGTGSLKITDRDINMVGVITGANFKSGTTNVHNVGVEAAGINVLGADTPIGTGATVYNSGLIVSKKGAEFQGVVTASSFTGNITNPSNDITTRNLKVTGIGTFNGNLNVLGTLTYEDVKNVDSAGIATARQGLRITGGGLDVVGVSTFNDDIKIPVDNKKLKVGAGGDLELYHNGSHNIIRSVNGNLYLQDADYIEIGHPNGSVAAGFIPTGATNLRHNGTKKIETTSLGAKVIGDVQMGGTAGVRFHHTGTTSIFETQTAGDSLLFKTTPSGGSTTERLRLDSVGDLTLKNHSAGGGIIIDSRDSTSNYGLFSGNANRASADYVLTGLSASWNSDSVACIYLKTGADTTNKDDGVITFHTQTSGTNTLSERLRINSTGNIGINQATPASRFHISEAGSNTIQMQFTNATTGHSGGTDGMTFGYSSGGSTGFINVCETASFLIKTGGTAAGNERLRITSGGDVGIGEASPGNRLVVREDIDAASGAAIVELNNLYQGTSGQSNASTTKIDFMFKNHNGSSNWWGGRIACFNTDNYNQRSYLRFDTASGGNAAEKMRITHNGRLLLGTTDNAGYDNRCAYFDNGNHGDQWNYVSITGGTSGGAGIVFGDGTGQSAANYESYMYHNNSNNNFHLRTNQGNNWFTFGHSGYLGVGLEAGSTRLDVKQDNGVAYNGNAQTVAYNAARFLNTSGHTSGGTYTGFQFNINGNSQNRICSIGMISESSSNKYSSLVFHTDDGGNRTEKLRINSAGLLTTKQSSTNSTSSNWNGAAIGIQNVSDTDNNASVIWFQNSAGSTDCAIQGIHEDAAGSGGSRSGHIQFGTSGSGSSGSCVERVRIDSTGRLIIGGTSHAGGGQLVVMGGNINAYAAVALGNKTTAPSDGHTFAMFRFNSGSGGTSRGAEIIAKADGAWTAGSSYPTKVEFAVTKKGATSSSGCMEFRQYGITHIYRPQVGAVNTLTSLSPGVTGYIGDDLGLGLKAVYYMGWKNSSGSSNYSHNMVDTYYSGHWGQHTQVLIWTIMHYYNVGFRMWLVNAGGGVSTVEEYGDSAGAVTCSSTLVGSGTHSGQDVWRRSITCTNQGTYTQHLWFCGLLGGGTNGHCGTNLSQSSADSYFSTRGGGLHFNTIGDADMKSSPFYSPWH